MVRKPSGERTSTRWPQRSSHPTVLRNVTTTPLICGVQASVTRRIRNLGSSVGGAGCVPRGDSARGRARLVLLDRFPVDELELARRQLDQGREALDPVAVVAVE